MQVGKIAFTGSIKYSQKLKSKGFGTDTARESAVKLKFQEITANYKNYVLTAVAYDEKRQKTYFVLSKGQNKRTEKVPFKYFNFEENVDNAIKIFRNLLMRLN